MNARSTIIVGCLWACLAPLLGEGCARFAPPGNVSTELLRTFPETLPSAGVQGAAARVGEGSRDKVVSRESRAREPSVTVTVEAERVLEAEKSGAAERAGTTSGAAVSNKLASLEKSSVAARLPAPYQAELGKIDPALQDLVARQVAAALAHERVSGEVQASLRTESLRTAGEAGTASVPVLAERKTHVAAAAVGEEAASEGAAPAISPRLTNKLRASEGSEVKIAREAPSEATSTAEKQADKGENGLPVRTREAAATTSGEAVKQVGDAGETLKREESWPDELRQTIRALKSETEKLPVDSTERPRLEALIRLLYLADGNKEAAMQSVSGSEPWQREYLKHQIHALAVYLDEKGTPVTSRRAALALRNLQEALSHLAAGSALDVRNLAFCSQVDGFGRCTEFPKAEFKPNQEVLLYAEFDNVTCVPSGNGYEASLAGSYQITDASGRRVAEHTFPVEVDSCRNRRRDFFIPFRVYIPKQISRGAYTLQLTVEDLKSRKFGQGSIDFKIVD